MTKAQNVFLIGPMGAGKTTVGRYLAKELKLDFYDSDQAIEARAGADIAWIFDIEGEAGFRKREEQMIAELTALSDVVIATGGGVILSSRNRAVLAARGLVVYLHVSVAQQLDRIGHSKDRPLLLENSDPKDTLEQLLLKREPFYRELADFIVDTDNLGPRAIAQEILTKLAEPPINNDLTDT